MCSILQILFFSKTLRERIGTLKQANQAEIMILVEKIEFLKTMKSAQQLSINL